MIYLFFKNYLLFNIKRKAEMTTQTLEQTKDQIKQLEAKLEELQQVLNVLTPTPAFRINQNKNLLF